VTARAPTAAGPIVLDIGQDVGAAVVTAPACLEGREVEIRAVGAAWDGNHAAFHMHQTADGQINAALFPQLTQGDWEIRLRSRQQSPIVPVRVIGGRVSTVAFPNRPQGRSTHQFEMPSSA
jgi:hypothetical protein